MGLRVAHERLTRICFNDDARELALVAVRTGAVGHGSIIGIGRLCKVDGCAGELAAVIADAWQGKGLGSKLLELMIEVARREQIEVVVGDVLHRMPIAHATKKPGRHTRCRPGPGGGER